MINEYQCHDDDEHEYTCRRCGSPDCDGLKNCDTCGEDTNCDEALCLNCAKQERIEEITSDPNFDPSYHGIQ